MVSRRSSLAFERHCLMTLAVLSFLCSFLTKCRHLSEVSNGLAKATERYVLAGDEALEDVAASVDNLDEFDVDAPSRVLDALHQLNDCVRLPSSSVRSSCFGSMVIPRTEVQGNSRDKKTMDNFCATL